jgi:hypothetical protein
MWRSDTDESRPEREYEYLLWNSEIERELILINRDFRFLCIIKYEITRLVALSEEHCSQAKTLART